MPLSQPGPQRGASVIGLAVLIGLVMLIPLRWFVRLGGRESAWELRLAKVEMAWIANRTRRDLGSVPPSRIRDVILRIELLRTPDKAELCDLMVAELCDLLDGTESWNEAGRRSIRVDELCRELWPAEMPNPDYDSDEATFRWHLYRAFGRMMEIGASHRSRSSRRAFCGLLASLEDFRRPDTAAFVDAVRQSGERWLAGPARGRPWIASFDFAALGPQGLDEVKRIWPRDAVMWGATLDEGDRRAIKEDLARRSAATAPDLEPGPEPAAAPDAGQSTEPATPCGPEPSTEPAAPDPETATKTSTASDPEPSRAPAVEVG